MPRACLRAIQGPGRHQPPGLRATHPLSWSTLHSRNTCLPHHPPPKPRIPRGRRPEYMSSGTEERCRLSPPRFSPPLCQQAAQSREGPLGTIPWVPPKDSEGASMAPPHSSPPLLKTSGPQTGVLDQQHRHTQKLIRDANSRAPQTCWFRDSGVRLATRWKTLSWGF